MILKHGFCIKICETLSAQVIIMLKVHAFQTFDLSSFSLPLTFVTLGKI